MAARRGACRRRAAHRTGSACPTPVATAIRPPASSCRDLILHHRAKLLSQLRAIGMAVSADRVLGGGLQHFELPTRDRQRAVRLARKIPAIDDFPRHGSLPTVEERNANSARAA